MSSQVNEHASAPRNPQAWKLVREVLARRSAGESLTDDDVVAAHPELMPELAQLLKAAQLIAAARAEVVADNLRTHETSRVAAQDTVGRARREQLPRKFGEFILLDELGRGGMGQVYRARQHSLGREVALKLIRDQELADDDDLRRFRAEAAAAAGLDHPNIVTVYQVGECDGRHFFTMRLVKGSDLSSRIAESPFEARRAATLMEKIARAVHVAHDRGVLHRDLKPANILLDAKDEPHVTDFGLAKRLFDDSGQTVSGVVVGTPSFMSPEQASGKSRHLDRRSDVYALGAVLYAMVTGRPPFRAESVAATLRQVVELEPVAPRKHNRQIDRDLETIILKCLEKSPDRRYASAQELADDLHRYLQRQPIHARHVGYLGRALRWTKREPRVAGLIAVILLTFVIGSLVAREISGRYQGRNLVLKLLERPLPEAPGIIDQMSAVRRHVHGPLLEALASESEEPRKQKLDLAMVPFDPIAVGRVRGWIKNNGSKQERDAMLEVLIRYGPEEYRAEAMEQLAAPDEMGDGEIVVSKTAPDIKARGDAALKAAAGNDFAPLWAAFAASAEPSLRSHVALRCATSGVPAGELLARLDSETDALTRYSLLLALSRYPLHDASGGGDNKEKANLLQRFKTMLERETDPGVIAATRATMDRWFGPEEAPLRVTSTAPLAESDSTTNGWRVDNGGHAMVYIQGPVSFEMGTADLEPDRYPVAEERRPMEIDHSYLIGAYEVTAEQFERFRQDQAVDAAPAGSTLGLPAAEVTWYEAAAYCNWLSRKNGAREEDLCYRDLGEGRWEAVEDATQRRGYRLPTEEEWEYACRAQVPEMRFFGTSDEDLKAFAWHAKSFGPEERIKLQPGGRLLPNPWGLFDVYGNVVEWCNSSAPGRKEPPPEGYQPLRGGSFGDIPSSLRSGAADFGPPEFANPSFGFRLARTILLPADAP